MTEIVVYLDALQDIATDIRRTVRDLDDCVRRAYNEVHSIHDSGRGLNDVRERADDLLRSHRAITEAGTRVEQSLSQCADFFARTDQELATMIYTYKFSSVSDYQSVLRTTMPNKWSLQYWFEKSAVNVDWLNTQLQRWDVWSLAQRYTWIATLATQINHATMHNQLTGLATTIDTAVHTIGIPAVLGSKIFAIDALLTQYLPVADSPLRPALGTTSSFATKIAPITAIVPHVTEELSLFTRELLTGDFRPWAEAFASHRADEVVMFGSAILRPLTSSYDATLTGLIAGSNGLRDLGIPGTDAAQQALTSLPTDFSQPSRSALQWATTDLRTIDTQMGIGVGAVVTQVQQLYLQGVSAT
jgi:hypothetical protein